MYRNELERIVSHYPISRIPKFDDYLGSDFDVRNFDHSNYILCFDDVSNFFSVKFVRDENIKRPNLIPSWYLQSH